MVSEVESSDTDQCPASQASEPGTESQAFPNDGTAAKSYPAMDIKLKQSFNCTECGLTFRKQDDFDRHRFAHTGVVSCLLSLLLEFHH